MLTHNSDQIGSDCTIDQQNVHVQLPTSHSLPEQTAVRNEVIMPAPTDISANGGNINSGPNQGVVIPVSTFNNSLVSASGVSNRPLCSNNQ